MTDLLKKIMKEFDDAKEDASFDKDHPVFKMAEHIDELKSDLSVIKKAIEKWDGHDYLPAYRELAFMVHQVVTKSK